MNNVPSALPKVPAATKEVGRNPVNRLTNSKNGCTNSLMRSLKW